MKIINTHKIQLQNTIPIINRETQRGRYYSKLSIKGERYKRELLMEVFDIDNNLIWNYTISQQSLLVPSE